MPSDMSDYDESETTADEFDAMWESATPVETVTSVAVNAPGQSFWLSGSTLMPANDTNARGATALLPPAAIDLDVATPPSAPIGTNVPQPA